jgi:hypothetical protein
MTLTAYCRSDNRQLEAALPDDRALLGTWVNLNRGTCHLRSITLARGGDGFSLSALAAGETGSSALGPVPARIYVADGTDQPLGFAACFETDAAETCVTANQTQGICVVQTYTTYREGAGRENFFTKEFFRLGQGSVR